MKARKVLAILSALLFAFVGITWVWLRSVESNKRRWLEHRVGELRRALESQCGPRPVLRGTPVPGDAWEDYLKGIELLANMGDPAEVRKYAFRLKGVDREKTRVQLEKYASAVDWMRKGTRRAEARRIRFHEEEPPFQLVPTTRLGRAESIAALASGHARYLSEEEGRPHEAMELVLDICQFAADVARNGSKISQLYGWIILSRGIDDLKVLVTEGKLSRANGAQLERELEQLETSFPGGFTALLGQLEWFGVRIVEDRLLPELLAGKPIPPEARPGWRHAFSTQLMLFSAFHAAEDVVTRLRDTEKLPAANAKAEWTRAFDEGKAPRNPFLQLFLAEIQGGDEHRRQQGTKFRLVRTAARYWATGEILGLDDPYGKQLLHQESPSHVKFWGCGRDGIDDGGDGTWNITSKDIVLEIPRRP